MRNQNKIPSKTTTRKKVAIKAKKEVEKRKLKGDDPIWVKSRNLASSLRTRSKPENRETIPTKEEIYKWLSREHYICHYCISELGPDNLHIDHKKPLTRGGTNELDNLCVCCDTCNRAKGELFGEQYRQLLELLKSWDEISATNFFKRIRMGHFGR